MAFRSSLHFAERSVQHVSKTKQFRFFYRDSNIDALGCDRWDSHLFSRYGQADHLHALFHGGRSIRLDVYPRMPHLVCFPWMGDLLQVRGHHLWQTWRKTCLFQLHVGWDVVHLRCWIERGHTRVRRTALLPQRPCTFNRAVQRAGV